LSILNNANNIVDIPIKNRLIDIFNYRECWYLGRDSCFKTIERLCI